MMNAGQKEWKECLHNEHNLTFCLRRSTRALTSWNVVLEVIGIAKALQEKREEVFEYL